jgi:hypothetical protein
MQVSISTVKIEVERAPMEINPDIKEREKERPDVSAEERGSSALLKWIRKLRWIGMEAEAGKLHIVLAVFTQRTGWLVDGSLDCMNGQVVAIPSVELAPIGGSFGEQ